MKIILIEWVDSAFMQGWMSREAAMMHTVSRITSVGILVCEDKDKITIVQGVSDKEDVGDGITIPRVSIKKMRTLKVERI